MTTLTTPAPSGTQIGDVVNNVLQGRTQLFDTAGIDALGLVTASPASTTLLGRLKAVADALASVLTGVNKTTSATDVVAIAPSDTVALAVTPKALYVTVAGNLALKGTSGVAITVPVAVNQLFPVTPTYVMATNTTATVVALI